MARQTEGERILAERWFSATHLRNDFPYMGESLRGEFLGYTCGQPKFNVYENGNVVSRELVQTPNVKNPTVGVILPGIYHFPTGNNTETLTVLEGGLDACVNDGPTSILTRDGTIVAPAGTTLNLRVPGEPCFYICRYQLKDQGFREIEPPEDKE